MVVGKHKAATGVGGVRRLLSGGQWRKGEFVKVSKGLWRFSKGSDEGVVTSNSCVRRTIFVPVMNGVEGGRGRTKKMGGRIQRE